MINKTKKLKNKKIIKNKKIKRLINLENRKLGLFKECASLLSWDFQVNMPKASIKERSKLLSEISKINQKFYTSRSFKNLLNEIMKEKDGLNLYEIRILNIYERIFDYYNNINKKLLSEYNKKSLITNQAWEKALLKEDFSIFEKEFSNLVELAKKIAENYYENKGLSIKENSIINFWLDQMEENLNTKTVDNALNIEKELNKILEKTDFPRDSPLTKIKYNKSNMKRLLIKMLKSLSFNEKRQRMDESLHPFTIKINKNDVRITVRFKENNFKEAITAAFHEFGHSLYELNIDRRFWDTPLAVTNSLIIHESQSRFIENFISKNKEFLNNYKKEFDKVLNINKYNLEEVYRYFNLINNRIRVEADEISYHLHIKLRYIIEKELLSGSLDTKDLVERWNELSEELLNFKANNLKEGVLQDIHWSEGAFGYFPTYSLGTIFSVQLLNKLEKENGPIDELIRNREYKTIIDFLKENVHKYGSLYTSDAMAKKYFGSINSKDLIKYLKKKYLR